MSYTPVLPTGGYAGWGFLKRTLPAQKAAFENSATMKRDEDYFRAGIGRIKTAEQLVADRRLLGVALAAFGLEADINNKFFIRKVLEDGTLKEGALANRLADKQYLALSAAFGFGDFSVPRTQISDFADKIISAYKTRKFETAVGEQSGEMRLALNAERELATLAARKISGDAKWFTIMGSAPMRQLFQTALGLPASFASIDLDQQLGIMKGRAEKIFGSSDVGQFGDPAKVEALIRRFLLLSDSGAGTLGQKGAGALQLLQATPQSSALSLLSLRR